MSKYRFVVILLFCCAAIPLTAQQLYTDTFRLDEQKATVEMDALLLDLVNEQSEALHAADTIDILTERLKAQHVARLQSGQCTLSRGFVFNDCVNNFERVADHCSNIALIVLENQSTLDLETHSNMENLKKSHREEYEKRTREYGQEYLGALARLAESAGEGPGGAQISLFQ